MSLCPTNCADFEMVEIKAEACTLEERKNNIRAIGFYKCDLMLPDPLLETSLEELMVTNKDLVFSNELVNVQIGEPVFEERKISDCRPAQEFLVEREITFEDRIMVQTSENKFLDYDFWQDKVEHSMQLNYVFVMCNGDLIVPRDENGHGLKATFRMHISHETLQRGGAVELKVGRLVFQGDPLSFAYKPELNLNDTAAVAGLW